MKTKLWFIIAALILLSSCSDIPSLDELKKMSARESFPKDNYLDTVSNKKALVIVAHDDDDCAMAGTIYKLKKEGWKIEQWCLVRTRLEEGRTEHPAKIICEDNYLILKDGHFRNKNPHDSTLALYQPIPREHIAEIYETEKVVNALKEIINNFKPSVIFTLDNVVGGYGNPDHIFLNQLVLDLFLSEKITSQSIYQAVYTRSMEEEINNKYVTKILNKWGHESSFPKVKKLYGVEGAPIPDVEINIQDYADGKMEYLRAYSEDARKNMRKFIPGYEEYDAKTYFSIFNREFFKVYRKQ